MAPYNMLLLSLSPAVFNSCRYFFVLHPTQALELVRDGFPFVGLLHISVPEPLPSGMHHKIPVLSSNIGVDGELVETGKNFMLDPFPLISATRQEGRLKALNLPDEVGFKVIGLLLSDDGEQFNGNNMGEKKYSRRNPNVSKKLLEKISIYMKQYPDKFIKVKWYE